MAFHHTMPIDSYTVLLAGLFTKAVLGGLFLTFWWNHRSATWYAWWSATFLLGFAANAFYVTRGFAPEFLAIGIGNVGTTAAFACCWQAARAFERGRPFWLAVLGAPALWFSACLVPGFMENVTARVVVSSLIVASLLGMTAFEFWRGRSERLPSRWPVIVLFSTFGLCFAIRIPLVNVLPFPFGALPVEPGSLGAFNLVTFSHTLILTVLLVAMTKERLELRQRTKAQTDPLTGALNRRSFVSRGTRLLKRHEYERAPLCLLFLDLDHFKSLNDRFGHAGGDDVLTTFVATVHDNIRPTDFLFRIGGEEFCCLLPHRHRAGAPRGRAHPSPVRNGDRGRGRAAGEDHRQPRHRLDRGVRLRPRRANAPRRYGGLCRQAPGPQLRGGGERRRRHRPGRARGAGGQDGSGVVG